MGTALVGLILLAVLAVIIFNLIKNKKKGKSSCGGNCAHCKAACHSEGIPSQPGLVFTAVEIDGMMCPMCESHVNDAVRNHFQVKSVKSSHKTGFCQIESQAPINEEELRKVIEESGYKVLSVSSQK